MPVLGDRLSIASHVRERRAQIRQSVDAIRLELETRLVFGNRTLEITALVELDGASEMPAGFGLLGSNAGTENA